MRILEIAISLFILSVVITSCGSEGTGGKTTASGYDYIIHQNVSGDTPEENDWVGFTITVQGDDKKILQEIGEGPNMPSLQIPPADNPLPKPNPIIEVLREASIGDSITLIMPVDSLGPPNPQLAGLKHVEYVINVKEIQSDAERKTKLEEERLKAEVVAEELKAREPAVAEMVAQTLKDMSSGKVKPVEKEGLKIIVHEEGDGKVVENGNRASMQYYGVLKAGGEEFDNSFKAGRPFTFTVGRGEVISGWDKGIAGLKKGAKATLIIPFEMAYGAAGRSGIPPKSDLVFYVEVEDVN